MQAGQAGPARAAVDASQQPVGARKIERPRLRGMDHEVREGGVHAGERPPASTSVRAHVEAVGVVVLEVERGGVGGRELEPGDEAVSRQPVAPTRPGAAAVDALVDTGADRARVDRRRRPGIDLQRADRPT